MKWLDREKIAGQSVGRSLVSLAVPAVTATFFTVIFEIIDMFWIGRLGPYSIAALSGASFFIWMLRGLGLAVATGTIALIARRTGEKDETGLIKTISNAYASSFLFSILIISLFLPLALHTFKWIRLDPIVAALAEDYTIVFLSGLIFVYLMMTVEFIIRGIGDTRTPMKLVGISLLLNAILDPLFIFQFRMGLKGAAYATILSQCIGAILMSIVLLKKIPLLKKRRSWAAVGSIRYFGKQFYTIIKIGGPISLSDAGFSFIYLVLSGIISIYGKEPLAAIGISHRLEALPFFICLGFSMAVEPMVGQFLGAGKIEKARKSVYLSLKVTSGIIFIISILYFLLAPQLYRIFTDDPAIIAHGVNYLRIVAVSEVFLALEVVLTGAFSGAGDTKPPFFIILPITFSRIPMAYLFAVTFNFGVTIIWVIIALTTFFKGILLFYQFQKGLWAHKKI